MYCFLYLKHLLFLQCCKVDEEFGIDWDGPSCNVELEGVAVPQAQLQRELTAAEIDTLPNPDVTFTETVDTYCETVQQLSHLLG